MDQDKTTRIYNIYEENDEESLNEVIYVFLLCVYRQKRSMGLTLAEDELSKLESERGKDHQAMEKECSCAEHILSKIEDIL